MNIEAKAPYFQKLRPKPWTLAVFLVVTLASVDVMVHQLVDHLEGESRYALLGISNSIMVAEITANRVLDRIEPPA